MSDQKRWIKTWLCWLDDPDLARLSLPDLARWHWLLSLVGQHGTAGTWYLRGGIKDLPPGWRVGLGSRGVRDALSRMPGVVVRDDDLVSHGLIITFTNWRKYQIDSSAERTRRWRQGSRLGDGELASHPRNHVTMQEERREDKIPPTPVTAVTDDCGHTADDPTFLSCSDRHFALRRAWLDRQRVNGSDA